MEAIALKSYEEQDVWETIRGVVDCADGASASGADEASEVRQTMGRVLSHDEGIFTVEHSNGRVQARRATSCLLQPEQGDRVLLVGSELEDSYVLAVLERPGSQDGRIVAEGDLSLQLPSGRFAVGAAQGVSIASPEAVSIAADRLEARAREGSLFVGSARLVGKVLDSVLDRVSQRVKHSFRHVEELDQVRSGQIDYSSRGMTRLHGENTLMTATKLVKADAKQIHIG